MHVFVFEMIILFSTGLERIAEEFGGKENITELLMPFNCKSPAFTPTPVPQALILHLKNVIIH